MESRGMGAWTVDFEVEGFFGLFIVSSLAPVRVGGREVPSSKCVASHVSRFLSVCQNEVTRWD